MKTKKEKGYCPVTLEPGLEEEACLLNASQRRAMAKMFRRWARQLEVSAVILDRVYAPPPKQLSLPFVSPRKQALN